MAARPISWTIVWCYYVSKLQTLTLCFWSVTKYPNADVSDGSIDERVSLRPSLASRLRKGWLMEYLLPKLCI